MSSWQEIPECQEWSDVVSIIGDDAASAAMHLLRYEAGEDADDASDEKIWHVALLLLAQGYMRIRFKARPDGSFEFEKEVFGTADDDLEWLH